MRMHELLRFVYIRLCLQLKQHIVIVTLKCVCYVRLLAFECVDIYGSGYFMRCTEYSWLN